MLSAICTTPDYSGARIESHAGEDGRMLMRWFVAGCFVALFVQAWVSVHRHEDAQADHEGQHGSAPVAYQR